MTVIKKLRKQKGMSQADLARFANLFPSFISKLESGKEKSGTKVQARVSKALEVSPGEIFDDKGWPLEVDIAEEISCLTKDV